MKRWEGGFKRSGKTARSPERRSKEGGEQGEEE